MGASRRPVARRTSTKADVRSAFSRASCGLLGWIFNLLQFLNFKMDFYGSEQRVADWGVGLKREPYEVAYSPAPTYTNLTTFSPAHTDRRVPSIGEAVVSEAEAFGDVQAAVRGPGCLIVILQLSGSHGL